MVKMSLCFSVTKISGVKSITESSLASAVGCIIRAGWGNVFHYVWRALGQGVPSSVFGCFRKTAGNANDMSECELRNKAKSCLGDRLLVPKTQFSVGVLSTLRIQASFFHSCQ